ncbi:MAG: hypothetical protein LLF89_05985, partial [Spirochaetaceae bacterium]|nr:hypothetical protein [Spirochaetaceae bacterium]
MSAIRIEEESYFVFDERFGSVAVVWSSGTGLEDASLSPELVRIILAPDDIEALQCNPHPVAFSGSEASLPGEIRPFVDFVHQILN